MHLLAVLVILGCVSASWQKCFQNHCPHHTDLFGCVTGTYHCQSDHFCEATTHLSHGNAAWVQMNCRPNTLLHDCWTLQAANDPQCDPNKHDRVCHWCCQDEQCMKDLALGIKPKPEGNTMAPAKTTMAHLPTGPVSMAPTTKAPTTKTPTTQVVKVDTTMAAGTPAICADMYLGNCTADFAGKCSEHLVQQLCTKTCHLC